MSRSARVRIRTGTARKNPTGQDMEIVLVTEDGTEHLLPAKSVHIFCDGRKEPVHALVRLEVEELDLDIDPTYIRPKQPEPPSIQPGAKCSNGTEFWCSLHCPLANAPEWPGGKNCGGARALCSEHCAARCA